MKICLITQNMFTLGGVQRVISLMLNEMSKKKQYEFTILMKSKENKENLFTFNENIKIKSFSDLGLKKNVLCKNILAFNKRIPFLDIKGLEKIIGKLKLNLYNNANLINFINDQNFDIVIGVGVEYPIWIAEISENFKAKTIAWNHSGFDSYFTTRGKGYYGTLNHCKHVINNLDEVLVLNNKDKNIFDKTFNINAKVLYNPISSNKDKISKLDNKNVVFAGRLTRDHKGLEYLISIIEQILQRDNEIKFIILGDGTDKEWLETQIEKISNNQNVQILGNVNNIFDYYQNASLLIQTSRWEGFGMTILEAMSCGVPVVSFHNDGPDEIINNGIDGYLIEKFNIEEFSEKSLKILNDKDLRTRMGINAIKRSEDFSLDKVIEKFENILQDCKRD